MAEFERDLETQKEAIRARSDIVEVIGQYTRLKKQGKDWRGLCPFHADKNPSFSVSPSLQTYRCWSCDEKGDVFSFIEKKENLGFVEAMEFLARRAGIAFERRGQSREQTSEREQMFAINTMAARYYQERLANSEHAREYLARRGILKQTQELWDLGFAPDEWEGLSYYLQRQRADLGIAAKLGLIRNREQGGGSYDTFRNRLMFPIHDLQGRVIAFGGRAMGDDPAKYLNSEQSVLFDKSRTLYGLVFARKVLSDKRPAVFVEGYMDVITTHQAGFTQCVATLGTSMTEEHARLLVRYSPRVIVCYDADRAGLSATKRAAQVWESLGIEGAEVRVAQLPPGEDPDSLVKGGKTADFQRALDNAVPRVAFEIDRARQSHDLSTEEGRAQALAEMIPILALVTSQTQRDKYVESIADLHPARKFDFKRAIMAISSDVEQYARRNAGSRTGRDRGYPLTEQSNGAPLANVPQPPSYQSGTSQNWGRWDPGTQSVVRSGQGGNAYSGPGRSQKGGREGGWRKREERDPLRDYSPPSLAAPPLSGTEKAERQLLRALFTADWRSYVLGKVRADLFITSQASEMFALAARTPAGEGGIIDPALVLRQALAAEERLAPTPLLQGEGLSDSPFPVGEANESGKGVGGLRKELFSSSPEEMPDGALNTQSALDSSTGASDGLPPAMSERAVVNPTGGRMSAKTSDFIREVLEDSLSVMSNEPLNEAVLTDCIRRLQQYREEQARREYAELLSRDDLTPDQRRGFIMQYHEKMRLARGSPPAAEDDSD
jgi:DNA primase